MTSRAITNIPQKGDKVYLERRKQENKQPNGIVINVNWFDREVYVAFHSNKKGPLGAGGVEQLNFEDFEGNYSPTFGGIWMLED